MKTFEECKRWVEGLTDVQLDAEIEQAHAALCDQTNEAEFRESAFAALYMFAGEKINRRDKK